MHRLSCRSSESVSRTKQPTKECVICKHGDDQWWCSGMGLREDMIPTTHKTHPPLSFQFQSWKIQPDELARIHRDVTICYVLCHFELVVVLANEPICSFLFFCISSSSAAVPSSVRSSSGNKKHCYINAFATPFLRPFLFSKKNYQNQPYVRDFITEYKKTVAWSATCHSHLRSNDFLKTPCRIAWPQKRDRPELKAGTQYSRCPGRSR